MATITHDTISIIESSILLDDTDVNGLNATPIDFIPAPGSNKMIFLIGGMFYLYYISTAYTSTGSIGWKFPSAAGGTSWGTLTATLAKAEVWGFRIAPNGNGNHQINEKLQCYQAATSTGAGGNVRLSSYHLILEM